MASIAPLCGELRPAESSHDYRKSFSWTETDVMVSSSLRRHEVDSSVNLMTIGPTSLGWQDRYQIPHGRPTHYASTDTENTERELAVPPSCPDLYRPLAAELSRQLGRATEPPAVMATSRGGQSALIETTSGRPVALRLVLPTRSSAAEGEPSTPIALLLPGASNLVAWFRAFLFELHESDPVRVPQAPPRLSQPSDWYAPQERDLADRIAKVDAELERLSDRTRSASDGTDR